MSELQSEMFTLGRLPSPLGPMLAAWDGAGALRALDWEDHEARLRALLRLQYGRRATVAEGEAPLALRRALADYFDGRLTALDGLAIVTAGTPFQRRVWTALRQIPAGSVQSYGALAERIERPTAVRAVGAANGANPISIVVPCHRVIGADGTLTGYGGGLERKRWLLAHEGALPATATGSAAVQHEGRGSASMSSSLARMT
jgi:methylated-DNA-[protein]-cysteine S-methyltransferase